MSAHTPELSPIEAFLQAHQPSQVPWKHGETLHFPLLFGFVAIEDMFIDHLPHNDEDAGIWPGRRNITDVLRHNKFNGSYRDVTATFIEDPVSYLERYGFRATHRKQGSRTLSDSSEELRNHMFGFVLTMQLRSSSLAHCSELATFAVYAPRQIDTSRKNPEFARSGSIRRIVANTSIGIGAIDAAQETITVATERTLARVQ